MSSEKCTVVVAAYNEERNIENCLESILHQTYKNIEILIVDDGSIDKTSEIIKEYLIKYNNIKYIYQKNSGAAAARKNGFIHCQTNYITFLDADDEFSEDAIELAMKEFTKETDAVLFQFAMSQNEENTTYTYFKFFTNKKIFTGMEAFVNCLNGWGVHGLGIFRRKNYLDSYAQYEVYNIGNENYINNDEVITKINFLNSRNIKISEGIYFCKMNMNSTTRKINHNYYKSLKNSFIVEKICRDRKIQMSHSVLAYDVLYVNKKYLEWKNSLPNTEEWQMEIRKSSKLVFLSRRLKLKKRLKFLRIYLRTFL